MEGLGLSPKDMQFRNKRRMRIKGLTKLKLENGC